MKFANNKLLLAILTIFCIAMIGVTTVHDEWLSPFRTAVGCLLMPVQSGVNRVGKSLYNNIKDREKLKTALEENKKLEERVSALTTENTRLQNESFELNRLRELYDLSQSYGQYRMTGARVIAKDTGGWFHVFRIDKGYDDGIRVDMNVMAGGGLVGIVTDVGSNYATVRSIIDDVSRVSGMAARSGDSCLVSGDLKLYEEGKLRLSDITDTADIKDGDRIVTSNVSAKYVPGLLIGYARDITTDPSRLTKSGTLIPAADFGTLQEVLVVLDLKNEISESGQTDTGGTVEDSGASQQQGIVPSLQQTSEAAESATAGTESGLDAGGSAQETEQAAGDSGSSGNTGGGESDTGQEVNAVPETPAESGNPMETEPVVIVESMPEADAETGSEVSQ